MLTAARLNDYPMERKGRRWIIVWVLLTYVFLPVIVIILLDRIFRRTNR